MYQVLARKWRPQNFDELVGQQHVARALRNAIESERIAHAYVFAGVRGIGKTTVARILAKCLNCERGPTPVPCNTCVPCVEITEGRSMDVLELDAASRRGIDSIRELQEVVAYAPTRDRYRILILDEFHMLTKDAFNALLKTLEEPPPQVVFVLATTEIQKILPTVLSRCQVFEFRRVGAGEVAAHLRRICDSEGVRISDQALDRIAWAGEGSVRDALSVLERVLAFCGSEVGDEDALQVLGAVRHEVMEEIVRSLAARDAAAMLALLDDLVKEGHDLVHFWSELVAALRDLLLLRVDARRLDLLSRTAEQGAALEHASEGLSREDLLRAFQIVSELEVGLRSSSQPRYLFEAALLRLADLGAVRPIEELIGLVGSPQGGPPPGTRGAGAGERRESPSPASKNRAVEPPRDSSADERSAPRSPARDAPREAGGPEVAGPPPFLADFLAAVHEAKPMLGALLEHASVRVEGDALNLAFASSFDSLRKQLDRQDFKAVLDRCAAETAGRPLRIRVTADRRRSESEPEKPARPDSRRRAGGPPADGAGHRALLRQATSEPGVKKLLHEFGAQVVEIRPLEAPRDLVGDESDTSPTEDGR